MVHSCTMPSRTLSFGWRSLSLVRDTSESSGRVLEAWLCPCSEPCRNHPQCETVPFSEMESCTRRWSEKSARSASKHSVDQATDISSQSAQSTHRPGSNWENGKLSATPSLKTLLESPYSATPVSSTYTPTGPRIWICAHIKSKDAGDSARAVSPGNAITLSIIVRVGTVLYCFPLTLDQSEPVRLNTVSSDEATACISKKAFSQLSQTSTFGISQLLPFATHCEQEQLAHEELSQLHHRQHNSFILALKPSLTSSHLTIPTAICQIDFERFQFTLRLNSNRNSWDRSNFHTWSDVYNALKKAQPIDNAHGTSTNVLTDTQPVGWFARIFRCISIDTNNDSKYKISPSLRERISDEEIEVACKHLRMSPRTLLFDCYPDVLRSRGTTASVQEQSISHLQRNRWWQALHYDLKKTGTIIYNFSLSSKNEPRDANADALSLWQQARLMRYLQTTTGRRVRYSEVSGAVPAFGRLPVDVVGTALRGLAVRSMEHLAPEYRLWVDIFAWVAVRQMRPIEVSREEVLALHWTLLTGTATRARFLASSSTSFSLMSSPLKDHYLRCYLLVWHHSLRQVLARTHDEAADDVEYHVAACESVLQSIAAVHVAWSTCTHYLRQVTNEILLPHQGASATSFSTADEDTPSNASTSFTDKGLALQLPRSPIARPTRLSSASRGRLHRSTSDRKLLSGRTTSGLRRAVSFRHVSDTNSMCSVQDTTPRLISIMNSEAQGRSSVTQRGSTPVNLRISQTPKRERHFTHEQKTMREFLPGTLMMLNNVPHLDLSNMHMQPVATPPVSLNDTNSVFETTSARDASSLSLPKRGAVSVWPLSHASPTAQDGARSHWGFDLPSAYDSASARPKLRTAVNKQTQTILSDTPRNSRRRRHSVVSGLVSNTIPEHASTSTYSLGKSFGARYACRFVSAKNFIRYVVGEDGLPTIFRAIDVRRAKFLQTPQTVAHRKPWFTPAQTPAAIKWLSMRDLSEPSTENVPSEIEETAEDREAGSIDDWMWVFGFPPNAATTSKRLLPISACADVSENDIMSSFGDAAKGWSCMLNDFADLWDNDCSQRSRESLRLSPEISSGSPAFTAACLSLISLADLADHVATSPMHMLFQGEVIRPLDGGPPMLQGRFESTQRSSGSAAALEPFHFSMEIVLHGLTQEYLRLIFVNRTSTNDHSESITKLFRLLNVRLSILAHCIQHLRDSLYRGRTQDGSSDIAYQLTQWLLDSCSQLGQWNSLTRYSNPGDNSSTPTQILSPGATTHITASAFAVFLSALLPLLKDSALYETVALRSYVAIEGIGAQLMRSTLWVEGIWSATAHIAILMAGAQLLAKTQSHAVQAFSSSYVDDESTKAFAGLQKWVARASPLLITLERISRILSNRGKGTQAVGEVGASAEIFARALVATLKARQAVADAFSETSQAFARPMRTLVAHVLHDENVARLQYHQFVEQYTTFQAGSNDNSKSLIGKSLSTYKMRVLARRCAWHLAAIDSAVASATGIQRFLRSKKSIKATRSSFSSKWVNNGRYSRESWDHTDQINCADTARYTCNRGEFDHLSWLQSEQNMCSLLKRLGIVTFLTLELGLEARFHARWLTRRLVEPTVNESVRNITTGNYMENHITSTSTSKSASKAQYDTSTQAAPLLAMPNLHSQSTTIDVPSTCTSKPVEQNHQHNKSPDVPPTIPSNHAVTNAQSSTVSTEAQSVLNYRTSAQAVSTSLPKYTHTDSSRVATTNTQSEVLPIQGIIGKLSSRSSISSNLSESSNHFDTLEGLAGPQSNEEIVNPFSVTSPEHAQASHISSDTLQNNSNTYGGSMSPRIPNPAAVQMTTPNLPPHPSKRGSVPGMVYSARAAHNDTSMTKSRPMSASTDKPSRLANEEKLQLRNTSSFIAHALRDADNNSQGEKVPEGFQQALALGVLKGRDSLHKLSKSLELDDLTRPSFLDSNANNGGVHVLSTVHAVSQETADDATYLSGTVGLCSVSDGSKTTETSKLRVLAKHRQLRKSDASVISRPRISRSSRRSSKTGSVRSGSSSRISSRKEARVRVIDFNCSVSESGLSWDAASHSDSSDFESVNWLEELHELNAERNKRYTQKLDNKSSPQQLVSPDSGIALRSTDRARSKVSLQSTPSDSANIHPTALHKRSSGSMASHVGRSNVDSVTTFRESQAIVPRLTNKVALPYVMSGETETWDEYSPRQMDNTAVTENESILAPVNHIGTSTQNQPLLRASTVPVLSPVQESDTLMAQPNSPANDIQLSHPPIGTVNDDVQATDAITKTRTETDMTDFNDPNASFSVPPLQRDISADIDLSMPIDTALTATTPHFFTKPNFLGSASRLFQRSSFRVCRPLSLEYSNFRTSGTFSSATPAGLPTLSATRVWFLHESHFKESNVRIPSHQNELNRLDAGSASEGMTPNMSVELRNHAVRLRRKYLHARQRTSLYLSQQLHATTILTLLQCILDGTGVSCRPTFARRFPNQDVDETEETAGMSNLVHPTSVTTRIPMREHILRIWKSQLDAPETSRQATNTENQRPTRSNYQLHVKQYVPAPLNTLYVLHHHINHPANENILSLLYRGALARGKCILRLLRLLSIGLFNPEAYKLGEYISSGAYGRVCKAEVSSELGRDVPFPLAVKQLPLPVGPQDKCLLADLVTEVAILEDMGAEIPIAQQPPDCTGVGDNENYKPVEKLPAPPVVRLLDYGVTEEFYWVVMERCELSLSEWRRRLGKLRVAQMRSLAKTSINATPKVSVIAGTDRSIDRIRSESVHHIGTLSSNAASSPTSPAGKPSGAMFNSAHQEGANLTLTSDTIQNRSLQGKPIEKRVIHEMSCSSQNKENPNEIAAHPHDSLYPKALSRIRSSTDLPRVVGPARVRSVSAVSPKDRETMRSTSRSRRRRRTFRSRSKPRHMTELDRQEKLNMGLCVEDLPLLLTIFREIVRGVELLHTNGVTHYDLKADNILLRADPVKLPKMCQDAEDSDDEQQEEINALYYSSCISPTARRRADSQRSRISTVQGNNTSIPAVLSRLSTPSSPGGTPSLPNTPVLHGASVPVNEVDGIGSIIGNPRISQGLIEPLLDSGQLDALVPGTVCVTDFGESTYVPGVHAWDTFSLRSRGTDCIKAPEMLRVNGMGNTSLDASPTSRQKSSISKKHDLPRGSSDIWALGCLLFELLTGHQLFAHECDTEWVRFFVRVTDDKLDLIEEDNLNALEPILSPIISRSPSNRSTNIDITNGYSQSSSRESSTDTFGVLALLKSMLTRDARKRPALPYIQQRIGHCIRRVTEYLDSSDNAPPDVASIVSSVPDIMTATLVTPRFSQLTENIADPLSGRYNNM